MDEIEIIQIKNVNELPKGSMLSAAVNTEQFIAMLQKKGLPMPARIWFMPFGKSGYSYCLRAEVYPSQEAML
jgi:hypothetical protein